MFDELQDMELHCREGFLFALAKELAVFLAKNGKIIDDRPWETLKPNIAPVIASFLVPRFLDRCDKEIVIMYLDALTQDKRARLIDSLQEEQRAYLNELSPGSAYACLFGEAEPDDRYLLPDFESETLPDRAFWEFCQFLELTPHQAGDFMHLISLCGGDTYDIIKNQDVPGKWEGIVGSVKSQLLALDSLYRGDESGVYPIRLDHKIGFRQMIALGRFDRVNPEILAYEPVLETGCDKELKVRFFRPPYKWMGNVHCGFEDALRERVQIKRILADLDSEGMRPLNLVELIYFGAKFPEFQRMFPVMALGTTIRTGQGTTAVPYLAGDATHRGLLLKTLNSENPNEHGLGIRLWLFAATEKEKETEIVCAN